MPSDESKGNQLDAIGSLAQRQLDSTLLILEIDRLNRNSEKKARALRCPGHVNLFGGETTRNATLGTRNGSLVWW